MVLGIETKFTGDFDAMLAKLEATVQGKVLRAGAGAMSHVIYEQARLNALPHKKSGQLYAAIYQVHADDLSSDTRQVYRISWNHKKAPHGHLIEFGTSRAPASPFIRPAFDRIGDAIKAGQARMAEQMNESTS